MFQSLSTLPADPILGLNQVFQQDGNPDKINLSIGVYQDAAGKTPIFSAVKKAEQLLIEKQKTKSYIAQAGDPDFLEGVVRLILGDALAADINERVSAVMTPGGCGAVRMIAELLVEASTSGRVWVSNPTWANHYPLLESAGLTLETYTYYDTATNKIDFEGMVAALQAIPKGDTVLLHGCCHNPTGADLTPAQWDQVISIVAERELMPFIDVAYQGFGDGLDQDAYGIRSAIERLPEVLIASSCSKNFGLYRERTGAAIVVSESARAANAAKSHIMSAARRCYSMSPYHGGGIVGLILSDDGLYQEWRNELETVRNRMNLLRDQLAKGLNDVQSKIDFGFVGDSKGMFCFLGIPRESVLTLRSEYAIYLLESTRINLAGLSEKNLPIVIERVADVIQR
jgi:aspartate aminotransferase